MPEKTEIAAKDKEQKPSASGTPNKKPLDKVQDQNEDFKRKDVLISGGLSQKEREEIDPIFADDNTHINDEILLMDAQDYSEKFEPDDNVSGKSIPRSV